MYKAISDLFYKLYSSLLNTEYYSNCWKQVTKAILRKLNKLNHSILKAYRVISLQNNLNKVSEQILARRLFYLAETTSLLQPSQIDDRLSKSAIDAALLLLKEVDQNKKWHQKSTILFLDVKGTFNHITKNQLLAILKKLLLFSSLIVWVKFFLQDWLLHLSFNDKTEKFFTIEFSISQGSSISSIFFLTYIRDLFNTFKDVTFRFYIDDISITTALTSLKKNVQILERKAKKIYQWAANSSIQFNLFKTELLHWTTLKETKLALSELSLPNDDIVNQKKQLND